MSPQPSKRAAAAPVCCIVDLCPVFAEPGKSYCVGHRFAKKLPAVQKGERCVGCERVLVEGDYVTRESSPGRNRHEVCPKDRPHVPRRRRGETPLSDGV